MNHAGSHSGTLFVVGLGPGAPGLLAPDAAAAIDRAEVVVGYRGYLDQLGERLNGKHLVSRELGEEVERGADALRLAREGKTVAVVSSGDAGVYAMAGVVCELAAHDERAAEIVVVPGITAACSAAARLGAPIAHDWACISLSDLLTPWDVIVRRAEAAARADFVIVLYNPASRTRNWQLNAVADIVRRYRAPETPVGLVENAFRPTEHVAIVRLDGLAQARVTMFTTIVVGSSRTFVSGGRMITPRIYAARADRSSPRSTHRTPMGESIMAESFAIIDRELGSNPADPAERAVVKRMIHASADFDYVAAARFAPRAIAAAIAAFRARATIVTDVEMLRAGVSRDLAERLGISTHCALDDPRTADLAERWGLTRSAAGMRLAAAHVGDGAVVAVGNAPTALEEAVRLVRDEGWRPACIVGIPVGFVGVEEAKARLVGQDQVPYVTSVGRKGGTAVTAATVNALLDLAATGAPA
jgi:precorrin-3B C17-methyltransferase